MAHLPREKLEENVFTFSSGAINTWGTSLMLMGCEKKTRGFSR
jgi:hypothetical protein